jgi:lipopolysaccharide exporter
MLWAYGSYVAARLLTLVATAILARLLTPADFGVVALAILFIELLYALKDLGVNQALIVISDDDVLDYAETAFVASVAIGVALTLVVAALGPAAATFFDESELTWMLPALGTTLLLRSLGMTQYALAQRQIHFRPRTIAEVTEAGVRGVLSIVLAVAGAGAWSLIWGYVAGTAALSAALWVLLPWRPSLRPRREHLGKLIRFGGPVTGVDILSSVNNNVDYILTGRVLGAASLGLYTLAFRLPSLLVRGVVLVSSKVLFPSFAAIDRDALAEPVLRAYRYTLALAFPMTAFLAILAEPLITLVFGNQWGGSVEPMRLLALYTASQVVALVPGVACKSVGRPDLVLKVIVPRSIALIAALAVFVDQGIVAVAVVMLAVTAAFDAVLVVVASRLLGLRARGLAAAAAPAIWATAALALPLAAIDLLALPDIATVAAGGLAGGAAYFGVLWLLMPDDLRRLRTLALPKRPERPESPAAPALN